MLNFDDFEVLTFDCYGTLIDWDSGIWQALSTVFTNHLVTADHDAVLAQYAVLEATLERGPYLEYKEVLRRVLQGLGHRFMFRPSAAEMERFAQSVRDWPAFADSPAALAALQTRYKLAILSNIDDDLFAASAQKLGVTFDYVITAQQVRSYKPSHRNFEAAFQRTGRPPAKILHVAQGLFHDHVPAKQLGLHSVWVNRRHEPPAAAQALGAAPDLEVPDLQSLAKAMGLM